MISSEIEEKLQSNIRPLSIKELDEERRLAIAKGYNVPKVNYENGIYIQQQAEKALCDLGVERTSLFFQIHTKYRDFPLGEGEELNNLNQVVEDSANSFWNEDYPGFSNEYLQLSSIEGEGSYFYRISTGEVFDVDWAQMDSLVQNELPPTWDTFLEFITWYYS